MVTSTFGNEMKRKVHIFVALLTVCCAVIAAPPHVVRQVEEIAGTIDLPPSARIITPFLSFTGETTVSQMFHTVGMPYTEMGAGIPRYFYRLHDGSEVRISGCRYTSLIVHISTNGIRDYLVMKPSQRKQLEELKAAEQDIRQVSSESAPGASPEEPSM